MLHPSPQSARDDFKPVGECLVIYMRTRVPSWIWRTKVVISSNTSARASASHTALLSWRSRKSLWRSTKHTSYIFSFVVPVPGVGILYYEKHVDDGSLGSEAAQLLLLRYPVGFVVVAETVVAARDLQHHLAGVGDERTSSEDISALNLSAFCGYFDVVSFELSMKISPPFHARTSVPWKCWRTMGSVSPPARP